MLSPLKIAIGGPDDEFNWFPSTMTQRANRHFKETGKQLVFYTSGLEVIDFIETHCVLTDAHYAGQPFKLMPWQQRLLLEMYAVERYDDESGWRLVHRWGLIGVPKKNGKTELAAALGIYHAMRERSAKVACAAASDEQADLLFQAASRICEWSDTLKHFTETREKKILFAADTAPGELRRVAAAAGSNDGKNLSAVLIDELHEWVAPKSRSVFTVMTQGGGARKEPINIMITTAGSDEDSVCFELYEHGLKVREGSIDDERFYFVWFGAEEGDDYKSPVTWKKANPSYGLILDKEFYEDIITKRRESEFCRYFLNMWMEADEIWEAAQLWDGLVNEDLELDPELPLYLAIDVGRRHDSCALIMLQKGPDGPRIKSEIWQNPYASIDSRHDAWSLNTVEIENRIRELAAEYPLSAWRDPEDDYPHPGPVVFYDPHFFHRSAEILEGEQIVCIEFPQTDARMVPASQMLFEMIKVGELEHDGNPTLRRHIRAVVAKEKERGWRIAREPGSKKHIDGAVALAMVVWGAYGMQEEETDTFEVW